MRAGFRPCVEQDQYCLYSACFFQSCLENLGDIDFSNDDHIALLPARAWPPSAIPVDLDPGLAAE